jgi:hypothetical protein
MALHFDSTWASAAELVTVYDQEITRRGLLVRGAQGGTLPANTPCQVSLHVAGEKIFELSASIAAVVPGVGVAVMFPAIPPELTALVERARAGQPLLEPAPEEPEEAAPHGPLTERLKALSVAEKIALAMSCDRETRFALLRDHNKMLHGFVLKNPRIGLDEVQSAAKMASLSPDALKFIADHKEWGLNSTIATSLVRNPKTMLPLALRLLERIPVSEVRAIAKGGARDQIVQAARKKLSS